MGTRTYPWSDNYGCLSPLFRAMYDELQAWVLKVILIIVGVLLLLLLVFGH